MGAIYAELHVAGHVFVLRRCTYGVSQATNGRGRPIEQVRHGHVKGEMEVPRNQFMEKWAATAFMPVDGYVVFSGGPGEPAIETVSWEAGQCVFYREEFHKGSITDGAYVCQWRIAAAKLVFSVGPPKPFVAAAPREHGTPPPQGFGNPTVIIPPSTVLTPLEVPIAEGLGAAAARVLAGLVAAPVLVPAALTLALILAASPPAHAPGIPRLPVNPDELRLRELVARHAAGTLTADEEAELIALLGKVKGVHIQKLSDLDVQGTLKGQAVKLPGFHKIPLVYTKRPTADLAILRRKFGSSIRKNFLKNLVKDPAMVQQLKAAGLTDGDIALMEKGNVPLDYEVHHKLPLDDGGDNSVDNLMLIKDTPYHYSITALQNTLTGDLQPGQTRNVMWPTYYGIIYPPTKP